MWSKNKRAMSLSERGHVQRVKESGCAICDAGGPQGIHGDKTLWRIRKMDEIKALNETLRRVYGEG